MQAVLDGPSLVSPDSSDRVSRLPLRCFLVAFGSQNGTPNRFELYPPTLQQEGGPSWQATLAVFSRVERIGVAIQTDKSVVGNTGQWSAATPICAGKIKREGLIDLSGRNYSAGKLERDERRVKRRTCLARK